ncbi:MAG TPA: hypothetical protein VF600_18305 [Abditibacteriaceae bacterium]|jgi:hypothetical protein
MKIHGVRVYPQSVRRVQNNGTSIFLHGRVSDVSDFFYIFRPTAPLWKGHIFADAFCVSFDLNGNREDPVPHLRERYGTSLMGADVDSKLLLLCGDDFLKWAVHSYHVEGAFLPIFNEVPSFDDLKRVYWEQDFSLSSVSWPSGMRALLHMWDDIYWQLFSTERSDIDFLVQTHAGDPRLEMYYVDFDKEYPDPSNQPLEPVITSTL